MDRKFSLKDKKIINQIYNEKNGIKNFYFNLFYIPNNLDHIRIALSVGRKFGNAVSRNLIKRRIRATLHPYLKQLKNVDLLFVIKPTSNKLNFNDIQLLVTKLLKKSCIITQ